MADSIPPLELSALLKSDNPLTLLDVRRKTDYDAAPKKIAGAVWLDPENADEWGQQVAQDRPVVVYCARGGSVSQSIANRLQQSHPDVKFLEGGVKAWVDLGEPVEE